jgi:hypothetical protein
MEHIFQTTKEGKLYNLVFSSANNSLKWWQQFQATPTTGDNRFMHNIVVANSGVKDGPAVYVTADGDGIRKYPIFTNQQVALINTTASATNISNVGHGGNMTLSANYQVPRGTGILWVTTPQGNNSASSRSLLALSADDLSNLWWSEALPTDHMGSGVYWNPPTVVNGKVYVATYFTGPKKVNGVLVGDTFHTNSFAVQSYGPRPVWSVPLKCAVLNCGDPLLIGSPGNGIMLAGNVAINGALHARARTNGSWPQPSAVTATNFAPPGAGVAFTLQTSSQADTFVVNNNGALYSIAKTSSGWQPPVALTPTGLAPAGAPVAAVSTWGNVSAYVVDTTGALEGVLWTPSGGWNAPVAVTAANYAPPGAQLAVGVRSGALELDVFSVGTDGALKYMAYSNLTWSGPHILTATNFAPPGAPVAGALDVHGYFNIMTIGNDGKLYTDWDVTPQWSGATALTGANFAPPGASLAAINAGNAALEAFLVNSSGTINWMYNTGASWTSPAAIGRTGLAQPGAAIGAAIENGNQVDVFAVSATANSGVVESVNSGSGWSTPVALP